MSFVKDTLVMVFFIVSVVACGMSTQTLPQKPNTEGPLIDGNWFMFSNTVGEVEVALQQKTVTTKGEEVAKGMTRTDAQVYNFVAKGGNFLDKNSEGTAYQWISKEQGNTLACTQITEDVIENVLKIKNLNKVTVNTEKATGVTASFFVTRSGDVFIWPPFEYENGLYVNQKTQLVNTDGTPIKADSKDVAKIYKEGYTFKVGTVDIIVSNKESLPTFDIQNTTPEALAKMPTIAYKDGANATSPVGLENIPFEGNYYENYLNNKGPYAMIGGGGQSEREQIMKISNISYAFQEKISHLTGEIFTKTKNDELAALSESILYQVFANGMVNGDGTVKGETSNLLNTIKIDNVVAKNVFDIELPIIEVETPSGNKMNAEFYITNDSIFIWPPLKVNDKYLIGANRQLAKGNDKPITTADKEDVNAMFYGDFSFEIPSWRENRIVHISNGKVVCE